MATKQPQLLTPANEVLAEPGEIVRVEPATPLEMMRQAMSQGLSAEQLEKWTVLAERWADRQASEAFGKSLAKFAAICPSVFKGRKTVAKEGSDFAYKFASFDDVMREVGPVLAECGISVGFDTKHDLEKHMICVTCRIRVGSHFEDRTFMCPTASTLKVSDAQKFGSALSYAKRYCLCAALNIVTTDVDDDGTSGSFEYIEPEQVEELNNLIIDKNADLSRFLKWADVLSLDKMLKVDFAKSKDMLVRKQRAVTA
jgi:ERF superfamily